LEDRSLIVDVCVEGEALEITKLRPQSKVVEMDAGSLNGPLVELAGENMSEKCSWVVRGTGDPSFGGLVIIVTDRAGCNSEVVERAIEALRRFDTKLDECKTFAVGLRESDSLPRRVDRAQGCPINGIVDFVGDGVVI